jgi:hypothetical protein
MTIVGLPVLCGVNVRNFFTIRSLSPWQNNGEYTRYTFDQIYIIFKGTLLIRESIVDNQQFYH